ncbi:acyltransferase [Rapidithrix thailandica]|uniref:Acyltransferase n=1 Tax=Rapidithrix thailandica TaxID=413964 RepID=A0AAW9SEF9_9BACT
MIATLFNTQGLNTQRLPWIDYAKGLAIVLVVYRHVANGIDRAGITMPQWVDMVQQSVYNFRMPLFFILAGMFVCRSLQKRSIREFLKYKLHSIMYPYFLWGCFQVGIQVFFSQYANSDRGLQDFLYLLYLPREIDQFWFLYTLFNVTVLFALFQFYAQPKPWMQLLLATGFYWISTMDGLQNYSLIQDTLNFYLYFALGNFVADGLLNKNNYSIFSSKRLLLVLSPLFLLSQWYWIQHPDLRMAQPFVFAGIAVLGSAFLFNLSFLFQKHKVLQVLRIIGNHSLYIYIMHVIVMAATRIVLMKFLGISQWQVLLGVGVLFGIFLPVIMYNLSNQLGCWFLYRPDKPKTLQRA